MQKSASSYGASSLPIPSTPRTPKTPSSHHFSSLFTLNSSRSHRPATSSGTTTASAIPRAEHQFGLGGSANTGNSFQDSTFSTSPPSSRSRRKNNSLGSAPNVLRKNLPNPNSLERKPSLGSLTSQQQRQQDQQQRDQHARFLGLRRRANSSSALRERYGGGAALGLGSADHHHYHRQSSSSSSSASNSNTVFTDDSSPPALPHFALASAAKLSRDNDSFPSSSTTSSSVPVRSNSGSYTTTSSSHKKSSHGSSNNKKSYSMDSAGGYLQPGGRALNRAGTLPVNGYATSGAGMMPPPSAAGLQGESSMVHQHITEMANKRISTLEYLRKAHEGRVYWFNTLLFDKPDLARMPYFDTRRLARRATNYLLLGLSLPTVIDLNSNTPIEFLRSLNLLLSEFESFQSLHPETGGTASGLARARMPNLNVFRRATPSAKSRRSSSANNDILYEDGGSGGGGGGGAMMANGVGSMGGPGSISGMSTASSGGGSSVTVGGNGLGGSASVVQFGQSEADLLPGEEYVHLLTPSLPFDPDFFETFATLCDVLIDAYTRLLGLIPAPRDCNAAVAELFTKADSRVRKIIVQGVVKEFEDTSRNGVRSEVANVGKIVLSGLM